MCCTRSMYDITLTEHKLDMLDMMLETLLNISCSDTYGRSDMMTYTGVKTAVEGILHDITGNLAIDDAIMDMWYDCNESGRYCIEMYMTGKQYESLQMAIDDRIEANPAICTDCNDYVEWCNYYRNKRKYANR